MKLYGNNWSIFPRRVMIYLAEKNIPGINHVTVDLVKGENRQASFLERNPIGTVPALELDTGAIVHQTTAILEYFEEVYPEPNMIGTTPQERAHTRDLANMVNDCSLYQLNYLAQISPIFEGMIEQSEQAANAFFSRYKRVNSELEQVISDGPFISGERLTYADCMLFALLQYVDRAYKASIPKDCPKLNAFYKRFSERPSAQMDKLPDLFNT